MELKSPFLICRLQRVLKTKFPSIGSIFFSKSHTRWKVAIQVNQVNLLQKNSMNGLNHNLVTKWIRFCQFPVWSWLSIRFSQPLTTYLGLDPTQDTPVEILHTILLGIVKYVWHIINTHWSDNDWAKFAICLQSTDLDGLTVPPLRAGYIIQYQNGLIRKHFKMLMQTMAFHIHGLVTDEEFELIRAVGDLGALLWVHEIDDMDKYLVSRSSTDQDCVKLTVLFFGRQIWKFW